MWNSIYIKTIPCHCRWERKGLCHILLPSFIRALHTPHMQRQRNTRGKKTNISQQTCGFYCIRHTNVHSSCAAGEFIETFLPPLSTSPRLYSVPLSHWCFQMLSWRSQPFVVVLARRSKGDFRESDRWESRSGGCQTSGFKEEWDRWEGWQDKQDRSQCQRKPLKIPFQQENASGSQVTTKRHSRNRKSLGLKASTLPADHKCNITYLQVILTFKTVGQEK